MSDNDQPTSLNAEFKIRDGMEGLHDLTHEAMGAAGDVFAASILKSIAAAYALGYNEAMAGKPAMIPGMLISRGDLPD